MTRVSHASSHRGAHAPAALDRARTVAQKKKKPYKIVLEAVTQEKRKLQSILTYHDQAPKGFGYVPVGYPEFTEWCKEQCRQRNLDVHIVSAKPKNKTHADPEKLSHHVHRIGHHFPLDIIDLACKKFGYQFSEKGLQKQKTRPTTYGAEYFERGIADYQQRQRLHGRPATETETKDHIRGAIREIFPKIPEADLASIVNHAFEEGTNRVGNAKELSLARRVQLAVVAHIRHTYTNYDNILKTGSWSEARQKVEHVSLAKLKEWRDEAGDVSNELEETFREVIVLDDDDDEESSDEDSATIDAREPSMEIVSSRATARDLQPEPFDRLHAYPPHVGRAPRRTIILQPVPARSRPFDTNLQGAHRPIQVSRVDTRALPASHGAAPTGFRPQPLRQPLSRPVDSRTREPVLREAHPMQMRDSNGQLYNLQPIDDFQDDVRVRRVEGLSRIAYEPRPGTVSRYARDDHVPAHPRIVSDGNRPSRPVLAPSSRRTSEQDLVLPSIERESDAVASPRRAANATCQVRNDRNSVSLNYADIQSPKRKEFPISAFPPEEYRPEPPSKRMRPVYGDEAYAQTRPFRPATESSRRPIAQPKYDTIDLTSSPGRPPPRVHREIYEPARPRPSAGPSSQAYVPAPPRSPARDVGGAYRAVPMRESSRAYIPEYDRVYDGRILPHVDSTALREEAARFQLEGGRYLRSGADYGKHRLH